MARGLSSFLRRLTASVASLSQREKIVVGLAFVGMLIFVGIFPITWLDSYLKENRRLVVLRHRDLETLGELIEQYRNMDHRFEEVQKDFDESQMSFADVMSRLDDVVKKSIGSVDYQPETLGEPQAFGSGYEKQKFRLRVRELELAQVIKLLYELEQGESSLFLEKVHVVKSRQKKNLEIDMEVFSIRKVKG